MSEEEASLFVDPSGEAVMRRPFNVGDHVTWNSEAGRVSGTIIKVHTRNVGYKGYTHSRRHAQRIGVEKGETLSGSSAATFDPALEALLAAVRACRACEAHLPLGPRPVLRAGKTARVLVVGQAPGTRVHATGIPWDDPSGERLRAWMGVDRGTFYDELRIAIIPMGFCYPGRGNGGDMPPRRECATLWLDQLLARLPDVELTLLIGQYAQRHFLGGRRKQSLTATVRAWQDYAPQYLPLPHPSPRNQPWFKRHPWFERQLVPVLRARITALVER
jgi:uracil-DNA glycosylase